MMITIFRDLGFFAASLILYNFFLSKGIIYIWEALALLLVIVFYVYVVIKMDQ